MIVIPGREQSERTRNPPRCSVLDSGSAPKWAHPGMTETDYWMELPPPCSAIFELNGESPCLGSSPTTMPPILTRSYRSIASSLVIRMQPEEIDAPIYSGWLVP